MNKAIMITYTSDSMRVKNFRDQQINLQPNELIMFEAVDTINQFEDAKAIATKDCLLDEHYITHYLEQGNKHPSWGKKGKGALGCDLSNILCYKQISQTLGDDEYCLLLEDDAILGKQFIDDIDNIIDQAKQTQSDYVHLCCNDKFHKRQYCENNKVTSLLYKMIPQWHTTAQLISGRGASTLLSNLPYAAPIDLSVSKCIYQLNATSSITSVDNGGAASGGDKNSQFGSLIW